MNKSCPVQPKEVTETYTKAAQIYADKLIAIRFDDVIEKIIDYNEEGLKISKYKDEFVTWMAEAGYDPTAHPEQEQFFNKIMGGLDKKFPGIESEDVFDDLFVPPLEKRIGNYFDENKRAIASAIIEKRKIQYANRDEVIDGEFEVSPLILKDRLDSVNLGDRIDLPPDIFAQTAGLSIGIKLLRSSGDFVLRQSQAASPDPEVQKRYFVDTLNDWTKGDNGYIYDEDAWKILDVVQNNFEDFLTLKGVDGTIEDYESKIESGWRKSFSDYFNKKVGTTSGVPPVGRTPFLLAKKKNQIPSTPVSPNKKPVAELTERSKRILEEYLQSKDLDVIFNNAENEEQETAILEATLKRFR